MSEPSSGESAPVPANGSGVAARTARLVERVRALELDALLVQPLVDVRYLTGFTGSNALVVVLAEPGAELGGHRFFSDFRYASQSAEQVVALYEREIVTGELLDALAAALARGRGRLGFSDSVLTVGDHRRLAESTGDAWELVACEEEVARLRTVKDAGEVAAIRAAAELADAALTELLERGLAGRTEREVAIELELRMRRLGAEEASFPSIVAAGPHAALPHAAPRDVEIPRDVLVTIDWGARHQGYCSDCTRTYATGEDIGERARAVYELVRKAQQAGIDAVRPGISGRAADAAAREVIERAGEGERFGHGLGHGVGLDIHDLPDYYWDDTPLKVGEVFTVEPCLLMEGVAGTRIEDVVVVTEDGVRVLSNSGRGLTPS